MEASDRVAASLRPFTVFWRGQQQVIRARDRMHAKIILYAAVRPESKWAEIR